MAQETIYRCDGDGCGKTKGETNHWWMMLCNADSFTILTLSASIKKGAVPPHFAVHHFCGEQCLTKAVSQHFQALANPEFIAPHAGVVQ